MILVPVSSFFLPKLKLAAFLADFFSSLMLRYSLPNLVLRCQDPSSPEDSNRACGYLTPSKIICGWLTRQESNSSYMLIRRGIIEVGVCSRP